MDTSPISFDDIGIIFHHLDLSRFLSDESVIQLSTASKLCLKIVKFHICHNVDVPLWGSHEHMQAITFEVYQPTSYFWRPQITLRRHPHYGTNNWRNEDRAAILLSSLHFNVPSFPQVTKRVKCLFECVNMFEGLPHLTYLAIRGFELNPDPKYLKQIDIRQGIVDHLPLTLTHLRLIANLCVDYLPSTITHLSFGYYFKRPVDHLPPKLTHLSLSETYKENVDHLPQSLTHLTFGHSFDNNIDHLPDSLTHLILGWRFNRCIDNLPQSLRVLKLARHSRFYQFMDHLPPSLKILKLPYSYKHGLEYLPNNTIVKQ